MIIQIYEVKSPLEAETLINMGVDHVGAVLLNEADANSQDIHETINVVRRLGGKISLIPLFDETAAVIEAIDACRPDIVHFCETLAETDKTYLQKTFELQHTVRKRFPDIGMMRTIPISRPHAPNPADSIGLAKMFEPISDYFLTDTVMGGGSGSVETLQPVPGFVGITGLICDWDMAAKLVEKSRIPVILAGGISPENVFEAIIRVRPAGVDSCTQTNMVDDKGRPIRFMKDFDRVGAMIRETRRAVQMLES